MRKPPALAPGSRLRIVALGSPPDPARLQRGARRLRQLGYSVSLAESVRRLRVRGPLAASDEERAEDLVAAFEDDEVDGIVCSNGGFGSLRVLPLVDWDDLATRAKAFVGYSDITVAHVALNQAGLVTFHGPMATPEAKEGLDDRWTRERLHRALTSPRRLAELTAAPTGNVVQSVGHGRASGVLAGGNLSLVAATLGTPWEIDTEARVLVLEDWNEPPFTVETLLVQLKLAGKLDACAALAFGEFPGCVDGLGFHRSVQEVVQDVCGDLGVPVLFGLPLGHGRAMHTVPLGVRATVDADAARLVVDEPATAGRLRARDASFDAEEADEGEAP